MLKKHCAYVCPDVKKYFCGEHQSAFSWKYLHAIVALLLLEVPSSPELG